MCLKIILIETDTHGGELKVKILREREMVKLIAQ
jgi:hypothetical protein